ncbi:uncharacterized protein LOC114932480 isoform X2 [Nylanderia fulva]|uniref:uncharacterized protein LOC114932480 isoform X2 n=1 Tax=Nylanderia fulva TaxID=613905 RepID=UPI0010FB820D|nr:uncharacterized protein LOC114932480 isoform X2 [Nylanderia fulva]
MTNANVMSDSQESALMDDETYKAIEQQLGGTLPLETINEELLLPEEKVDTYNKVLQYTTLESVGKCKILKEEEEDTYFPAPELFSTMLTDDIFTGQLNFQCSLGTGGTGQDWLYSETLEKVFIKMEKVLPMRFTWEPPMSGTLIRL